MLKHLSARVRFITIIVALISLVGLMVPPPAKAASLSDLLRKQADLQNQAAANQKKIDQAKSQVNDLQGAIADLDDSISTTEAKISNTEDQIAVTEQVLVELGVEINQAEAQLSDLDLKLRHAYANLYELSQSTTYDSVLTTNSLSDLVTQTQYIQSLQTELQTNIDKVNATKTDLQTKQNQSLSQKAELDKLKASLDSTNKSLGSQRSQKNYLLVQTQGQQAQYEALLKKLQAEQENISDAIYQARRAAANGQLLVGGTGGYPWASEPDPYAVDPWYFYKRQCTSYAAWKFQAYYGLVFYNTRPGEGSAYNWPNLAHDQGYQTTTTPRANAIVSIPRGTNMPYGHVAWVTKVNSNGTVDVEEFNWSSARNYDVRTGVNMSNYGSNVTYIYP